MSLLGVVRCLLGVKCLIVIMLGMLGVKLIVYNLNLLAYKYVSH